MTGSPKLPSCRKSRENQPAQSLPCLVYLAEYEPTLLAQRTPQATTKAKNLALVAPSKDRNDDDDEDDEEDIDDEEMAMMVRKFRKFFRKKGGFQKGESSHKKDYKKERTPVCFECKKPGHFKAECPSLQRAKGKDKRKAFVSSIWVNSSDEEDSDEEEVANLCLVAREDGEEASSDFDSIHGDEVTLPKLQEAYNEVHREFFRLCKAYKVLRIKK